MTSAKASSRVDGTEASHWPISALDPSMILPNAIVEILAAPVADIRAKLASNRTRVTVMPVRGHPGRSDASHRFGRSKELLCRGHIAGLAQHHVHRRASAIDCQKPRRQRKASLFAGGFEAVRDWEAKLTPALAEELRRSRKGNVRKVTTRLPPDHEQPSPPYRSCCSCPLTGLCS
jgi:hypothetical protein